uniref:Ovule protein n=1 Tax=Schistosoma curassoni TaxID=6186 RepID=A0A183L6T3_9TREM
MKKCKTKNKDYTPSQFPSFFFQKGIISSILNTPCYLRKISHAPKLLINLRILCDDLTMTVKSIVYHLIVDE